MLRRRFLFAKVYEEKPVYTYTYTTTDGQMLDLKSVQNHKYENGVGSFETYSKNCLSFKDLDTLESVMIPKDITHIIYDAFCGCTSLTSIEIPGSIISISDNAFDGCTGLKEVHISDLAAWCNIDFNGNYTNPLYYANNLYLNGEKVTDLVIPNGVTEIKQGAFYCCTSLESVKIGNNVTSIGDSSFSGCESLTNVIIPDSITSIGSWAFNDCIGLTNITIPNNVTIIGGNVFEGCTSLINISVDSNNTKYDSRENCNAIIETETNTLIAGCKNTTIPDGVLNIGAGAFENCDSLTSIEIPNSVTSIEGYAFRGCNGLTSITIPNSVTTIRGEAFKDCIGLTSVIIGNSVKNIQSYAFLGCSMIKTVFNFSDLTFSGNSASYGHVAYYADKVYNAPNGSIEGDFVFGKPNDINTLVGYLGNATELSLPTDYKGANYVIGSSAFNGYNSLTSIEIPNSVTNIGSNAFYRCTDLVSVTIPNSVTSIGQDAFDSTSWYDNQSDGVVYVGKVFYRYKGTMPANTSIAIEDGTLGIAGGAFRNCSGLTNVTIPNSITNIGDSAFYKCTGLTSIEIPNSVTSIGDYVLSFCTQLNEIISLNPISPKINTKTFYGVIENGVLKIPKGSNYSSWMSTSSYYLGYYNWTIEEIETV